MLSLRMRLNGYLGTSDQKFDSAIRLVDLDFPWDGYNSTLRWRLGHIGLFAVFVHNFYLRPAPGFRTPSFSSPAFSMPPTSIR